MMKGGKTGHIINITPTKKPLPDPDRTGAWGGRGIEYKKDYVLYEIVTGPPEYTEEDDFLYIPVDYNADRILGK